MPDLVNVLGYLACLFGGVWLWTRMRAIGLGRLPAAALACLVLWGFVSLVRIIGLTVSELWLSFLTRASPLLPIVIASVAIIAVGIGGWLAWMHWRARRFFGR